MSKEVTRRQVVKGAAAVGVAAGAAAGLAACGGGGGYGDGGNGGYGQQPEPESESPQPEVDLDSVPVGGGIILPEQDLVVTQPTEGDFRAFSATCTHQGCTVANVVNGEIRCPCHGSRYSIEDGSVVGGPAPRPLPEREL